MAKPIGARAKAARAVAMDSPSKRSRLAPRRNPYWQTCGPQRGGLCLGYRKAEKGPGAWIVRRICDKQRDEGRLGEADDAGAQPGALPYAAAVTAAIAWGERLGAARADAGRVVHAPITLRAAVAAYVAERKARSARHGRDAETRLAKHLLSVERLARKPLAALTERDLADWARGLAGLSGASVARLLNDTKAALNHAWGHHHRMLPAGWRDVVARGLKRPNGAGSPAGEASHHRLALTDADIRRLVEAAAAVDPAGDFGRLVVVLAATGARLSQAAKLRVADVQGGTDPRLMIPTSAKGRPGTSKRSHQPVPVGHDVVAMLQPAMTGRGGHDLLLMKWRLRQEAGDKAADRAPAWMQDSRVAWDHAAELSRPWRRALAVAGLPAEVTPYRLRDASIIRGLRAGLPVRLVAQIHDTSAAMVEKHYASHISDALSEVARRAVVPIAPARAVPLRAVS